ncbi:MAG: hypothetical protein Q4C49_08095 [Bacillota bacterium]|nr:hypothetical protein [Bacillota bacterium]
MENNLWYKVDNVAKVFLATYNKRDTRSIRLSCTLKEAVDPAILQEAVHLTAIERPQFQVEIHKGLFWHYFEASKEEVKVREEFQRPCPLLYGPNWKGPLHYSVTYWQNRINLDMFHALTDGTGGLEFLNIIVQNYLKIKYPEEMRELSIYGGAAADDMTQDSFKKNYENSKGEVSSKTKKAYQIQGPKLPYKQEQFFEAHMSVKAVLSLAKQAHVSMSSYLAALLAMAIYEDMPALARKKGKPVTISVPVNLRNFYKSSTARNFFNSIYITHVFTGQETIESLAADFNKQLKEEIEPEKVKIRMDRFQKLERFLLIRMVPLAIKNPVVGFFSKKEQQGVSATLSNVGKIQVPDLMKSHIESYSACCSTEKLFITVTSYEDDLVFGISSAYRNTSVLKTLIRELSSRSIEITVSATDVVRS